MATTGEAAPRVQTVMHELRPRRVTVSSIESIGPRMTRVTFNGEELADFISLDPDDHMKLAFPPEADEPVELPVWGPTGPDWTGVQRKPALRDFTPRRFDRSQRELVVDFVLHGEGPASTWAATAAVGQELGVVGPRGSHVVDDGFDWYLMIGDETALPAIERRLEEFEVGTRALAIIEIDSRADEHLIETNADATIVWAYRDGVPVGQSHALAQAVRTTSFPAGDFFVWAGGEATALREIRRYLLREAGAVREWAQFSGHWKQGVSNHDHHEPIED